MLTLYHLALSPYSRKVRVALAEKGIAFTLKVEKVWERRPDFLRLNPACQVPVLIEEEGHAIPDSGVICEYLEERFPEPSLLGHGALERAETRRLVAWFDIKFGREASANLLGEKLMKRFLRRGEPNSEAIRAGLENIHYHLDYIAFLAERRKWLGGEQFSLADIAAAAHLSCIDYIGDVPWAKHPGAKDWYARVKSRPTFRPLLAERVPGLPPPAHYADLDF
ncbi:MAG: glutathione S-transferase family protein [Alphaproteobacteria bacterium]|nr:glutathione S-transferase family protein [Alphaproteobacteria bacterium]